MTPTIPEQNCDSEVEETTKNWNTKVRKRKRKHRSSGSPKDKPQKKPLKMDNVREDTPLSLDDTTTVQLSPELQELERRLNANMLQNIASSIEAALKPIKDSIEKILNSSDLIIK